MVSEPTIRPSTDELVYRAKHYHDLAAVRNKNLICASCGSELNSETEKVFSHPVIGTLQCKDCWDQLKHINFSVDEDAAEKYCRLCGHSKKLYVCGRANCPYTFCKKCIKRNVSIFPISPEEDNWECFICNPKPFWALRAICAVVMESKRNKRKSASHANDLSLPSVRRKLVQAKRMQKSLQSLCDKEDDDSTTEARPLFANKRRVSNEKNLKLYTMDTTDSSEGEERNIKNSTSRKYRRVESDSSIEAESLKSFVIEDSNSEEESEKCTQNTKKVTCNKSSSTLNKKKLSKSRLTSEIKNLSSDSEEETMENGKERNSRYIGSGKTSGKEKRAAVKEKNTSKQENKKSEQSLKQGNVETYESESENSSSGKEFQKSKFFRSNHKSLKRMNDNEKEYGKPKKSGRSESLLLIDDKYPIDKKQNIYFKTHVSEFLDEFKQICSESGSHMAYIKYKYCRKQLLNQNNAKHLILKFQSIIDKLKIELNKQQEDLISFYDLWCKKCESEHVSETKSVKDVKGENSSSNDEAHRTKNDCKRKSTNLTNQVPSEDNEVVSECDSKEIFSDEEMKKNSTEGNINTRKKNRFEEEDDRDTITKSNVEHRVNRVLNSSEIKDTEECSTTKDGERTESTSPILGSIKPKKNVESNSKATRTDIVKRTDFNRKTAQDDTKSDDNSYVVQNSHADEKDSTIACTNKSLSKIVDCNNEVDESLNDMFDTSLEMETVKHQLNSTTCSGNEKTETNGLQLGGSDMNSVNKDIENETEIVSKSSDEKCVDDVEHDKSMKAKKERDSIENRRKEGECERSTEEVVQKLPRDNNDKLSDDDSNNVDVEETNDISEDVLESEERAKKTMLATDSESSGQEGNIETNVQTEEPTKVSTSLEDNKAENKNSDADSNCSTIVLDESRKNERKQGKKSKGKSSKERKGKIHDSSNDGDSTDLESNDSSNSSSNIKENGKKGDQISDNEDDSDNLRAKKALLTSSNSETSSSDQGSKSLSIDFINSETDTSSKISILRNQDLESDTSVGSRVKRRRLMLSKNKYYMDDKKLRMNCRVVIVRLQKKVLERYATALERSKQRLDYKTFKSLINLDNLKRSHKRNSANDTDSTKSSKDLKKNTQKNKIAENSSLDDLTKAENDEITTAVDEDSNGEINQQLNDLPVSNEEIVSEADRVAKNNLLNSSDSSIDVDIELDKSDEDKSVKNKKTAKKEKKKPEEGEENCSDDDEEAQQRRAKSSWRKNKLLTEDILNSDSDVEKEKWVKSQEKTKVEEEEDGDGANSDNKNTSSKRKKNNRRRIPSSDSDSNPLFLSDSDSSDKATSNEEKKNSSDERQKQKQKKRTRKRNNSASSNTDSESAEKSKPKRKRIKKMPSDSDSDSEPKNSQGTPGKSGRKNIRKVLKDKQVAEDTKQAAKEEEERLKRIAERQKLYNEMYEMRLAGEEKVDKLVLDFNTETKEELISVHKEIVKRLKPHQAQGIKFMWDACFESLERIKSTTGSGCIIAHCMGLGKTLQVIGLIHTLLTHASTGMKTAMVVCPLSTVLNWVNEFNMWLSDVNNGDNEDVEIFELTKYKKNFQRRYLLEEWQRTGGVLVIGYEMFRNLTGPCKGVRKSVKEVILQCLIDPGPDIIVCDEGHLLKNEDTALSKCMKRVKTLRRIVLTGTPLQNNLIEYHCMVQFVKPNLLGTRREFLNRFVNPITNGQFDNSTPYDVTLMKKRAHVLHKMLEGCVQRFDYSVLTPFLPPKQEYVIFVRLTEVQIKMYRYYLDNLARRQTAAGGSLFSDFQALQRIWTHPIVLRLNAEKIEKANEKKFVTDSETSVSDYDSSEGTSDSSDSDVEAIDNAPKQGQSKRRTRNNSVADNPLSESEESAEKEWWAQFVEPEDFKDMRISAKLMLLFGILKECEQIGDKVLVFSQSLYSLSLIEEFLEQIDKFGDTSSEYLDGHTGSWTLDLDYFRLDGQSSAENRSLWCKLFNNPSNMRARLFLISTRAGGLGINLTAANRVIIFDASWNPSHDVQSIFRVYRFGQKKPCYVYRFLASGTMEEKIYNRQVTKLSLSCRVVDEQQIERHYSNNDLSELYKFEQRYTNGDERPTLNLPKDRLLAEIVSKYKDYVENYHEHDSLLENKAEEELNEEDRKQAWLEYEEEKKGKPLQPNLMASSYSHGVMLHQYNMLANQSIVGSPNSSMQIDYENLQQLIRKDYPNATPEQQKLITTRALHYMYSYWEKQAVLQPAAGSMIGQQRGGATAPIILDSQRPQQQTNYSGLNRNSFVPTNASTSNTVDDDVIEIETSTGNAANTILPPVQSILQSSLMSDSKGQEE